MLRAEDYDGDQLGDSKVLFSLARELRKEPEQERFRFLMDLLASPSGIAIGSALRLSNKCLQQHQYLEQIFDAGLGAQNGRRMASVVQFLVPKLGLRKVVHLLKEKVETDPRTVWLAYDWLARMPDSDRDTASLHELRAALQALSPPQEETSLPPESPGAV